MLQHREPHFCSDHVMLPMPHTEIASRPIAKIDRAGLSSMSHRITDHICHATRCTTTCQPEHLMCPRHWAMVPPWVQSQVWETYRDGQCDDGQPSPEWFDAAHCAIMLVSVREFGARFAGAAPEPAKTREWEAFKVRFDALAKKRMSWHDGEGV